MLNFFPEGTLPGAEKRVYSSRDAGSREAIGVFLWGAESEIDKFVEPRMAPFGESIKSTLLPAVALNSNVNTSVSTEQK